MKIIAKPDFRQHVIKAGYSLRSLAVAAGLAPESVTRLIHGRHIRAGTAYKICAQLGVSFDELFELAEVEDGKADIKL